MLTTGWHLDIVVLCEYCLKGLCTARTQTAYEKEHDTCIYCGKRNLLTLGPIIERDTFDPKIHADLPILKDGTHI